MFIYDSAEITYVVTWGKLDSSNDIEYTYDLNKKEAKIYTKARMLGQNLKEVMDISRIERDIIRYEKYEYDSDIRNASISIYFRDNQEQPLFVEVKEYLKDLLIAHKVSLAHEVVEAQINVFSDSGTDWHQVALELAMEVNCPGYAKKYQDGKFNRDIWEKEREKYLGHHPELNKKDESKLCGKRVRDSKKSFIRQWYNDPVWLRMWTDMTYMFDGTDGWCSSALVKSVKPKRLRGCQLIGSPFATNPCILTKSGKKVKVNTSVFFEPYFYGIGLCPFNAEPNMFTVKNMPDAGAYYDYRNLHPGKWGFIDMEGSVVIEPQYVYALGAFGPEDKEFFAVAKLVNKKVLWGVLDYNGKESIPCQYPSLRYLDDDIIKYQEEEDGLFGLMRIDGTVLLSPMFGYIWSCHFSDKNSFIIAGDDLGYFGIYSLEKNRYIVPCAKDFEYPHFDDETKTIKICQKVEEDNVWNSIYFYYDYDGNLIKEERVVS